MPAETTMSANSPRILVVEDQKPMMDLLVAYLQVANYASVCAGDGAIAWDILQNTDDEFDVILLDRRMPNMNGMELMALLKNDAVLKNIPVIMQTAADSAKDVAEGIDAGVYYYLTKPIDQKMLLSTLAAAVSERTHYKDLREELEKPSIAMSLMSTADFQFRTLQEADALLVTLVHACPEAESLMVGLSELLVNAIEHGNLGITHDEKKNILAEGRWTEKIDELLALPENQKKFATVHFERDDDKITFTIADEGKGFDWQKYIEFDPARMFDANGRGIAIAHNISFDELTYNDAGNQVTATINLDNKTT
jgi:phosphoserine phosphatase RsbU/P